MFNVSLFFLFFFIAKIFCLFFWDLCLVGKQPGQSSIHPAGDFRKRLNRLFVGCAPLSFFVQFVQKKKTKITNSITDPEHDVATTMLDN